MVAGDAPRVPAGAGDRRDRQRRGIGGEYRIGGADRLELAEQRLLGVEPLDDRLDDEVAVGEALEGIAATHPGKACPCLVGRHLAALGESPEGAFEMGQGGIDGLAPGVVHDDIEAALREQLGDSPAHRTGADDADASKGSVHGVLPSKRFVSRPHRRPKHRPRPAHRPRGVSTTTAPVSTVDCIGGRGHARASRPGPARVRSRAGPGEPGAASAPSRSRRWRRRSRRSPARGP